MPGAITRILDESLERIPPDPLAEPFLTVRETADLIGVTIQSIYNWIEEGRLRATKFGKEWRIAKADIRAIYEAGALPSSPQERE